MGEDRKGLVGAIRQVALPLAKLAAAERHGKRQDQTSLMRRVRNEHPLVYGTLDLQDAQALHLQGVQRSRGSKTACIHALVQYPTSLIDADSFEGQYAMLMGAVDFMNRFHGQSAVFSARLDRDERGQHVVDVFLMPRYTHVYKDGRTITKASPSKFSKAEAKRRYGRDDVRSQGSALQAAWHEYMRDVMQLPGVQPPQRKLIAVKDRLEPEEYGLRQDRRRLETEKEELGRIRHDLTIAQSKNNDALQKLLRDTKVLRSLQISLNRPISKALDDILDVEENER